VVESAFGILTLNGSGTGMAAALDANGSYLSLTNSVNPGEVVNLWGSGIGPAAGDETNAQTPVNLSDIPVEVDIGGISADVRYRGRSVYPGLDQIQVVVPAGIQAGCFVSVVVRTGSMTSNFATIPVAASGRICAEPALGITSDLLSKQSFAFGNLSLQKNLNTTPSGTSEQGYATAQFVRLAAAQFAATVGYSSVGSCIVISSAYSFLGNPLPGDLLDAGAALNLTGPNGKVILYADTDDYASNGFYAGQIGVPAAGDTFSFDNGAGGADVKGFMASVTLAAPLVWANEDAITGVNRANGVTVRWTGGAAGSFVRISGTSVASTGPLSTVAASFTCAVPASTSQFRVPPGILLSLPPTGTALGSFGSLSVGNVVSGPGFTAPGLDAGLITTIVNSTIQVPFQ
jgi:hypothetical protein